MAELGDGWYFLGVLWSICLITCWCAVRMHRPIVAKPAVILAILMTLLCIAIPKSADEDPNLYHLYQAYPGRMLLVVFLFVIVLLSGFLIIGYFCLTPDERIRYTDWINTNHYFN